MPGLTVAATYSLGQIGLIILLRGQGDGCSLRVKYNIPHCNDKLSHKKQLKEEVRVTGAHSLREYGPSWWGGMVVGA